MLAASILPLKTHGLPSFERPPKVEFHRALLVREARMDRLDRRAPTPRPDGRELPSDESATLQVFYDRLD